jgi:hypothetical protein
MNGRLAAFAVAGALLLGLAKCGSDPCDDATSKINSCSTPMPGMASSSSGGASPFMGCDAYQECKANCVNSSTCTEINSPSPTYSACLASCNGK